MSQPSTDRQTASTLTASARQTLIVGNWKMAGTLAALEMLEAARSAAARHPGMDLGFALPSPLIAIAARNEPGLAIGAQDVDVFDDVAHTGCVSAALMRDVGARFAIVGHSERRHQLRETGISIRRKAEAVLGASLQLVLCIGESAEVRDCGDAIPVVLDQMHDALPASSGADVAVAYEPRWAIGTGRTPTDDQIGEMHTALRDALRQSAGNRGDEVRLLYGGSVTAHNAGSLLAIGHVDGLLVGGASLTADTFLPIIDAAGRRSRRAEEAIHA